MRGCTSTALAPTSTRRCSPVAVYFRKSTDPDGPPTEHRRARLCTGDSPDWVILEVGKHGKAEWVAGADTNAELQRLWAIYFAR